MSHERFLSVYTLALASTHCGLLLIWATCCITNKCFLSFAWVAEYPWWIKPHCHTYIFSTHSPPGCLRSVCYKARYCRDGHTDRLLWPFKVARPVSWSGQTANCTPRHHRQSSCIVLSWTGTFWGCWSTNRSASAPPAYILYSLYYSSF